MLISELKREQDLGKHKLLRFAKRLLHFHTGVVILVSLKLVLSFKWNAILCQNTAAPRGFRFRGSTSCRSGDGALPGRRSNLQNSQKVCYLSKNLKPCVKFSRVWTKTQLFGKLKNGIFKDHSIGKNRAFEKHFSSKCFQFPTTFPIFPLGCANDIVWRVSLRLHSGTPNFLYNVSPDPDIKKFLPIFE